MLTPLNNLIDEIEFIDRYELKPREHRFVMEYLECLDPAKAVTRAGYVRNFPDQVGRALLKRDNIKGAIRELQSKISEKTKLTLEYKLECLKDAIDDCRSNKMWDKMSRMITTANKMQGHNLEKAIVYNVDENVPSVADLVRQYRAEIEAVEEHSRKLIEHEPAKID
jgi:phage terminase small subunit